MEDLSIKKKKWNYLSSNFEITWERIEPVFQELRHRNIHSASELEQWLKDRSELEAALEEDFAWRYIRMTCDTSSEQLLANFQYFATEIEPKVAPLNNELNKKFIASPYLDQIDQQ